MMHRERTDRTTWRDARRLRTHARAVLAVPAHERIVAVCRNAHGDPVLASDVGCYWMQQGVRQHIPWGRVLQARWDTPRLTLFIQAATPMAGTPTSDPTWTPSVDEIALDLASPGSVPDAVHACVTESVGFSERIGLTNGVVLLVARRAAAAESAPSDVTWTMAFAEGADPTDSQTRAQAEAALRDVRAALGI